MKRNIFMHDWSWFRILIEKYGKFLGKNKTQTQFIPHVKWREYKEQDKDETQSVKRKRQIISFAISFGSFQNPKCFSNPKADTKEQPHQSSYDLEVRQNGQQKMRKTEANIFDICSCNDRREIAGWKNNREIFNVSIHHRNRYISISTTASTWG